MIISLLFGVSVRGCLATKTLATKTQRSMVLHVVVPRKEIEGVVKGRELAH